MKNLIRNYEGLMLAERVHDDLQISINSLGEGARDVMFAAILALIASLSGADGGDAVDKERGDRAMAMLRSLCEMPERTFVAGIVTLCKAFDRAIADDPQQPTIGTTKPRAV